MNKNTFLLFSFCIKYITKCHSLHICVRASSLLAIDDDALEMYSRCGAFWYTYRVPRFVHDASNRMVKRV